MDDRLDLARVMSGKVIFDLRLRDVGERRGKLLGAGGAACMLPPEVGEAELV